MKRYGNLWNRIVSMENLRLADAKARKGKMRSYGVRMHDRNREENLRRLQESLINKTYHTSSYDIFKIHKPKERLICRLPYYPDRIVHHAVMNVLEDIWVRTFPYNTYSCIKNRGIEGCDKRVEKIIRRFRGKPLYCLKLDIKKYYPSIDHEVMKRIIRKKIKCRDTLWLLDEIIDSCDGMPIGNYLSQFLANLYLCYLIHELNGIRGIFVTEYADDIVVYAESKELLRSVFFGTIVPYVEAGLRLRIKENWQVFPVARNRYDRHGRALDYVGYKFFREQKLMRKSIKQNFAREVSRTRLMDLSKERFKRRIAPWIGWAKHSNSKHFVKTIIPKKYESVF